MIADKEDVEMALDELRALIQSGYWELRMSASRNKVEWRIYPSGYGGKALKGASLDDCMTQMRAAAGKGGE